MVTEYSELNVSLVTGSLSFSNNSLASFRRNAALTRLSSKAAPFAQRQN